MAQIRIKVPKKYFKAMEYVDIRRITFEDNVRKSHDPFWDDEKNFRIILAGAIDISLRFNKWACSNSKIKNRVLYKLRLFMQLFTIGEVAIRSGSFIEREGFFIEPKEIENDDENYEILIYFGEKRGKVNKEDDHRRLEKVLEEIFGYISTEVTEIYEEEPLPFDLELV